MAYTVETIDNGFWCITDSMVRCFLFEGAEQALLVDCGLGGDLAAFCRTLTSKPIQLVLTHSDPDHVGAIAQFEAPLMHPAEFASYAQRGGKTVDLNSLWDGQLLDIGTFHFEVILIPGHTAGSIALLEPNKRFILTGDSAQSGAIYMFGPGRNLPALLASIRKLQTMASRFDRIYASHGDLTNTAEILDQLEDLICDVLQGVFPPPQPAAPHLPADIHCYRKNRAQLLLRREKVSAT